MTKSLKSIDRLLDGYLDIYQEPGGAGHAAYLARYLLHCTLPHSDPGPDLQAWTRTNGNLTLTIEGWYDTKRKQRLFPYGSLPRLILYWIVTEATRTQSKVLDVGDSYAAFIRELGLEQTGGGRTGVKNRLMDQMRRLMRSKISFEQSGPGYTAYKEMLIGAGGRALWDEESGEEFQRTIILSEEFFQAITQGPIPVDKRALGMLRGSSMALDLYGWFVSRTWRANQRRDSDGIAVTWAQLHDDVGGNYKETRAFKHKVIKDLLPSIRLAYPDLKLDVTDNGVVVHKAKTPIPAKPKPLKASANTLQNR